MFASGMASRTIPPNRIETELILVKLEIWTMIGTAPACAVRLNIRIRARTSRRAVMKSPFLQTLFHVQSPDHRQIRKVDLQTEITVRYVAEMEFSDVIDRCCFDA